MGILANLIAVLIGETLKAKISGGMPPETPDKGLVQSKTAWGVVVMVIPLIARALGYELGEVEAQALVEAGAAAVGALLALYGRIKATKPIGKK